ncbi:hypothetical protein MHJ82_01180 [Corynebacterium afermentans]|uniref:SdrD B-like domain-containing protein n=1 Tax=Corynebacterium afermentans TaxID=38286 RepID=UPI0025723E55|nr:SdrD B-like domain-containing protein [Corynebacterium afermentans]MCG7272954.1 hypothetical protein [Corynebacterium afermentans]
MSENKGPNAKKNRWWRSVAAVVSTVALGIGGVAVPGTPVASAWIQRDIPQSFGKDLDENYMPKTTASFWQFDPETLKEDGSFAYTIQGSATAPKPKPEPDAPVEKQSGASDIKTMTVWVWPATSNVTLKEPAPADFRWESGEERQFASIEEVDVDPGRVEDADGNEIGGGKGYKIVFENIDAAKDSFTADLHAQLNGDIPAGERVTAASFVESTINPDVFWDAEEQWIEQDPSTPDTCAGVAHGKHRLQGGGYGRWMAEMYLGSLNGNLELRGAPRITFTLPNGTEISGEDSDMEKGQVDSPVLDERFKQQFEENNPNTVWGQKFDWPFDINTHTGDFWLPTGTVLEIEQRIYDLDKPCSDKKWGGEKLHHRAMLTSAAADVAKSAGAFTNFVVPEEPCDCELGSVGDKVWVDTNRNGKEDPDEKTGVPGVTVVVMDKDGKEEVARTVTDKDGNWKVNLKPGDYTVVYEPGDHTPSDKEQVKRTVTVEPGKDRDDVDLGILPSGSVGDRVWDDEDGDGKQGENEKGLENVVVLVSREGEPTRSAVTDANGDWKIEGLNPNAEYDIRFVKPEGWEVTGKVPGSDESGLDSTVTVEPGEYNNTYDLGLKKIDTCRECEPKKPNRLGDLVWVDTNGNGKQDPDETEGAPDVTVIVRDGEGNEVTRTVTDEEGKWKVDVPSGDYEIEYRPRDWKPTDPEKVTQTATVDEGDEGKDYLDFDLGVQPKEPTPPEKEIVPTTVTTTATTKVPTPGKPAVPTTVTKEIPTTIQTTTTAEAPKRSTIGDKVWEDTNGDGKEDPDEKTGIPNVPVVIVDKDGNEVTRTVSDEDGNWKVDVEPGEYTVRYEPGDRTPSDKEQVERTITVEPGEDRNDIDLGILPSGSVGDRVWNDEDGDGKQGENEKGLENVVVLVSREGEPTRSAVTDANGDWKIEGLNPNAEYDIRFVKPEGWEVTGKVPGSDESGLVSKVTVKPNEYNDSYDLGLKKIDPDCDCEPVKPGTIGNRVWIDHNGDGKQDPNETEGAPDVTVIVRDKDGNEVTRTVTDEEGNWKVNVEPGDYEIEYRPRDWKPTDPKRVTQKVTVEEGKDYLDLDLGVQKPKPGEPTPPTEKPEKGSSSETLDRCVANAVRSPLLYLVPVALLGAFGGEIARPYMGAINEQVNQINAQFQEAMRRNSPDWGHGGRGGRDNDQFAELRGQIDAANRRIAELGQDPNVQRFGTVAAGIIGLIAAGGVLYDWCSNEKGEAFTSIGGSSAEESGAEGRQSSSKDAA